MISDAVFDAVGRIRKYLDDPTYAKMYEGAVRSRIEALVQEMEEVRKELDASPESKQGPTVQHIEGITEDIDNLKGAITGGQAVHVYYVPDELDRLFDYDDYDSDDGKQRDHSRLRHLGTEWLVSDMALTEEQIKSEIRKYLPEAEELTLDRSELLETLKNMEILSRFNERGKLARGVTEDDFIDVDTCRELTKALQGGGVVNIIPEGLKRRFETTGVIVTVSDEDFTKLTEGEEPEEYVCVIPANTASATA